MQSRLRAAGGRIAPSRGGNVPTPIPEPPIQLALANLSDVTWLRNLTANNAVSLPTGLNGTTEVFRMAGANEIYYIALLNFIHKNRNKFKLYHHKYGTKRSDFFRLEEPKCFTSTALSHDDSVPNAIIRTIYELYNHNIIKITIGSEHTEWRPINCGVRQGCPLSPLLFNIYINSIIRHWRLTIHGNIPLFRNCTLDTLLYADHQVLFATNEDELQYSMHHLNIIAQNCNMKISPNKTKIMAFQGFEQATLLDLKLALFVLPISDRGMLWNDDEMKKWCRCLIYGEKRENHEKNRNCDLVRHKYHYELFNEKSQT
ncbi:hypothetical protein ANN_17813 [Periplaneta americana]|uniref:Reverse transcriptase domain-containing protein n=1 Tax=Periplaneta americana TaxID=6978 RepID=A0ABQ8STZ4_PERAM|nr:hypothetical protein ANN_17813 [Periplaneta americana]